MPGNAILADWCQAKLKRFSEYWLNSTGGKTSTRSAYAGTAKGAGWTLKMGYTKVTNFNAGKKLADNLHPSTKQTEWYDCANFVTHAKYARRNGSNTRTGRKQADPTAALPAVGSNTPLFDMIKQLAAKNGYYRRPLKYQYAVKRALKFWVIRMWTSTCAINKARRGIQPRGFEIKNPADAFYRVLKPLCLPPEIVLHAQQLQPLRKLLRNAGPAWE